MGGPQAYHWADCVAVEAGRGGEGVVEKSMPPEPLRLLGQSRLLTHPQHPCPSWNSLWQLSQVKPFWNPAPFIPGFEPTEMI